MGKINLTAHCQLHLIVFYRWFILYTSKAYNWLLHLRNKMQLFTFFPPCSLVMLVAYNHLFLLVVLGAWLGILGDYQQVQFLSPISVELAPYKFRMSMSSFAAPEVKCYHREYMHVSKIYHYLFSQPFTCICNEFNGIELFIIHFLKNEWPSFACCLNTSIKKKLQLLITCALLLLLEDRCIWGSQRRFCWLIQLVPAESIHGSWLFFQAIQ